MPQKHSAQASIFDLFADPEIGCELKAMSQWLDADIASSSGWRRSICANAALRRPDDGPCRPKSQICKARQGVSHLRGPDTPA